MAHINMSTPHDSENGKYARTDQIYFKIRKFDEAVIGVRLKHPNDNQPPSDAQKAAQDTLTAVAAKVKTALADPDQKAQYKTKWKAQRKYKTLTGYVFHLLYKEEVSQP